MNTPRSTDMTDDDRDWKIDLESLEDGEDEIETLRSADPEPGSPSIEHTAFVLLGVAVMLGALLILVGVI